MSGSVILAGARTPIGRLLGALSSMSAVELGGIAIKAALERSGVAPEDVAIRDHGAGAPGRSRSDPLPPGRGQGRASR